MPKAMQELDLLVTLSAGSVIAEAMAAGKPVIGTPVGSTSEMIVHDKTGYIVPLNPIEGIADKIVELCQRSRTEADVWGNGQENTLKKPSALKRHVQKIQDVYEKLLITDFYGQMMGDSSP